MTRLRRRHDEYDIERDLDDLAAGGVGNRLVMTSHAVNVCRACRLCQAGLWRR
jgi:hypothetical protein